MDWGLVTNRLFFLTKGVECNNHHLCTCSATTVQPSCWAVLPQASQFNVLAAVEDKLYILDPFEAVQQASSLQMYVTVLCRNWQWKSWQNCWILFFSFWLCLLQNVMCRKESPVYWVEVAVSLNGRAVALVDRDGYLWGGSSDFKVGRAEVYFFPFLYHPYHVCILFWHAIPIYVLWSDSKLDQFVNWPLHGLWTNHPVLKMAGLLSSYKVNWFLLKTRLNSLKPGQTVWNQAKS